MSSNKVEDILAAHVVRTAENLFGWEGTFNWMLTPQHLLKDQRPVDLLATEEGREEILRVLETFSTGAFV